MPLDEALARRFQLLGLRTLGQFAALPAGAVLTQFGQPGRRLHHLAQGLDDRPVLASQPQPSEQVTHQFDQPVADRTRLIALGRTLVADLSVRLQASHRVSGAVTLSLSLENGTEWSGQQRLRRPTHNAERLAHIIATICLGYRSFCP